MSRTGKDRRQSLRARGRGPRRLDLDAPAFELLEPRLLLSAGALPGDANLDGTVNVLDLAAMANNFGSSGASWAQCDFNGDTEVDVLDLAAMANRFGEVGSYTLTVNSGTGGGGSYQYEDVTGIAADAPAAGKEFDQWTGDTAGVTDIYAATTSYTMPAWNATVTATYEWITYPLTVNSGSGDGSYHYQEVVDIVADPPPSGQQFAAWTGDTAGVGNVNDAATTYTMPNSSAAVTATYGASSGLASIHLREHAGAGYTVTPFDDCQIRGGNDIVFNSYNAAMRDSTGQNYYRALVGIKGLFTELPTTDAGGGVIDIIGANLHIFRYWGGDASDTVYVDRVTTDWLTDAAGASEADTTWEHRDKSSGLDWASSGGDFGTGDYTTTGQASHAWGTAYKEEFVLDVTDMVADIYGTENNCGFVLSTSSTDENRTICTSEIEASGWPSLQIVYEYRYPLTVTDGSGDGTYYENTVVAIAANAPATGYQFQQWTGDTAGVADVNDPTTTVTMPDSQVTIAATYVPSTTYALTVNSGSGDGDYTYQEVVGIVADAPGTGMIFDQWTGDIAGVADVLSASTTYTMPEADATVTATYTASILRSLTVNSGSGDGTYYYHDVIDITADAPATGMVFDVWTGDIAGVADVNAASTTVTMPNADVTVTATYKLHGYILTVNSGTGDGDYLYLEVVDIAADAPPTGKQFDVWTGDTAGVTEIYAASTTYTMPAADATITATYEWIMYSLTVNSGTGDGSYHYGETTGITADTPAGGMMFDEWTGDIAGVANVNSPSTTYTMPNAPATVTATYTLATGIYSLTVVGGSGGGSYDADDLVVIVADTPPAGQKFNMWIGHVGYLDGMTTLSTSYVPGAQIDYLWLDGTVEAGDKFKVTMYDQNHLNPQYETISASSTDRAAVAGQIRDAMNGSAQSNFTKVTAGYAAIAGYDTVPLRADTPGVAFFEATVTTESDDSPADGQLFWWNNSVANHSPPTDNITKSSTTYTMPAYDATVYATYRDADAPTYCLDWWPKTDLFNQENFGAEIDPLVYDHWGSTMAWEGDGEYEYESKTSAFVACETTLPSYSYVEYGTATSYGTQIDHDERYNYLHMFYLTGLAESTTYHYRFVATDERGNILTGADKTLTTATPANVLYLAGGSIASPYALNQAGKTYLLQADVVAQGRAFEITADNITLDLGGHTVIYNNVDNQVSSYLSSAFGVFGQYRTNTKVLNGTLKQGDGFNNASAGGTGYSPVMLYAGSGNEVVGVTMEYFGSQVGGIHMLYTGSSSVAHHNVILDRGGEMINRHQGADAIRSVPTAHHNLILRARHRGIAATTGTSGTHSAYYDNEIYVDAVCTNGYNIFSIGNDYVDMYGNRLFGGGYMLIGVGTVGMDSSNPADNCDVYDNLIHLQAAEPDWRWPEYGATSNVTGWRNTWGNTNTTVHDNTILVFARDGGYARGGAWIYSTSYSTNVVFEDNVVKQKQEGYDQIVDKAAMCMSGKSGTDQAVVTLRNNRIISNFINVSFADGYGTGGNTHWYGNTFEKFDSRSDYVTFLVGYPWVDINGHELYDSVFVGGASYDSITFISGATANSWFKVGWTLTVNTDPGATVQIWDDSSNLVASGTANGSGVFTATLIQYKRAPSGKTYETPHHVHTTLSTEFAETDVTMDATKSIDLYPV